MKAEPNKAYIYQPYPITVGEKIFGVAGLNVFGYEDEPIKGLTKSDAEEIARVCNENPEFASNFVRQIRARLQLPDDIGDCGCRFESVLSNAVLLCDECSDEHFKR